MPSRGGPAVAGEPLIERQVEADVAPSWDGKVVRLLRRAREQSSLDAQALAEIEQPAWYADEPADDTNEISLDASLDHFTLVPRCRPAAISRISRRAGAVRRAGVRGADRRVRPCARSPGLGLQPHPPAGHAGRRDAAPTVRLPDARLSQVCRPAHRVAAPTDPIAWLGSTSGP